MYQQSIRALTSEAEIFPGQVSIAGHVAADIPRDPRLPHFLIIGAQKSASSWLHKALQANRAVYMPRGEISFFENPDFHDGDPAPLLDALRDAPPGATIGIKRPAYLARPECPGRIAALLPDAKLIAILRNPVERAISAYYDSVRYGLFPFQTPDRGLREILRGRFDPPYSQRILEFGLYAKALARYRNHFPRSQIHLFVQGRGLSQHVENYGQVCTFLGIANDVAPEALVRRRNVGTYSETLLRLIRRLNRHRYDYDFTHGRIYERHDFKAFAVKAASKLARVASDKFFRMSGTQPRPNVSPQVRQRLLDYYMPDIERLERMTDLDLTAWKSFDRAAAG